MDFVFVDDVARANILAAQSDVTDEVFNVAGGVEISINDLAHALLEVMGSDQKPEYGPERRVNAVPRRLADTGRAARRLSFNAEVDLHQGLKQLVEWWRQEQADGA
jgi:UDP-glucose 4-epimerase